MQNEHIEWFKRFAACYLMYANSNFDRIVREAIARDKKAEEERKEKARLAPFIEQMEHIFNKSNLYFNKIAEDIMKDNEFMRGTQWPKDAKIGTTFKN